ncbi:MAG TPA: hypothetical protein VMB05_07435 [Solirubrobacteraceae bacterium]|nr:hypothetical protein [Solirubrobacteraceae bacterium]HUB74490.1 hypothetical protein [Solirubrobacteraceae bacterium]
MGASDTEELADAYERMMLKRPVIDFTKIEALEARYTDAMRARAEAETIYTQAQKVDTHNAAVALREGKAAPTPKASPKKLEEATRNVEVAREALAQEQAEFREDIEARKDDLSAELAAEQDRLQVRALAALEEVERLLGERAQARAVQDWLRDPSRRVGKRSVPGAREFKALREVIDAGDGGATYKERQNKAVDDWNAIVERAKSSVPHDRRVPVFDPKLGHSTVPAVDEAIEREVARMIEAGEPLPESIPKKWSQKLHLGKWAPEGAVPGLTPQQKRAAA